VKFLVTGCNIIRSYIDHNKFASYTAFVVYHILSCSIGSISLSSYVWLYVLYAFV